MHPVAHVQSRHAIHNISANHNISSQIDNFLFLIWYTTSFYIYNYLQMRSEEADILTPSPPPPHARLPTAVPVEEMGGENDCWRKDREITPYERMDSVCVSRRHGDGEEVGVVRRESGRRKNIRYFSSVNNLPSKGALEESGVTPLGVGENYSGGKVQMMKKRLGLMEGSVFTGSLPDLAMDGEDGEEGEGEEGGEDEYIDPREIASVFIFPNLSRRDSQKVLRRMDTLMNTGGGAMPTYLKIIGPDEEAKSSLRRPVLNRSAASCYTTDDDLSSVDWDAGDEAEHAPTSPTQDHTHPVNTISPTQNHTHPVNTINPTQDHAHPVNAISSTQGHAHRGNRVRRRRSNRMTAVIQQDSDEDDERIYECIDDITLPTGGETRGLQFQVSRKVTLPRRRSKVTANSCRQPLSTMKGLDGYEYLDLSPSAEGVGIPRWTELSPALPPPRKTSAPVKNGAVAHIPIQPTLSVPVSVIYSRVVRLLV